MKSGLDFEKIGKIMDARATLGYFGQPYWEIYPYQGDVYRVPMNDIDELLTKIEEAFNEQ